MAKTTQVPRTKKFNGKTYKYYFGYNTKTAAVKSQKRLKKDGWNVRVVPIEGTRSRMGTLYVVYKRRP